MSVSDDSPPSAVPFSTLSPGVARTAVLAEPGQIEVRETDLEPPGADEVRVRLEGCGVCASNVPPFEGRSWFDYPFEPGRPGHEGWGIVDAVGPGVERITPGDRVGLMSQHAYATHDTTSVDSVVELPEGLDRRPFPAEPLACAMNVFRRSDISAGDTVAVVGAGFLGCLLCELAADRGARVAAVSRRPFSRQMAERHGAEHSFPLDGQRGREGEGDTEQLVAAIHDWAGGEGCDRVIEATGKQAPLSLAGKLPRVRGRLVIAGYHQDGPRQIDMQSWNWRGLDVVNAHERDPEIYLRGMREAVEAVVEGRLEPYDLFTDVYPLSELDEALERATERPEGFMKALVLCR